MQKLFENWRRFINESEQTFREEREKIYKSYENGANKIPWVDGNGLLRRKVLEDTTPQSIVDEYYNEVILPQLKNAIFNTPIKSYPKGEERNVASFGSAGPGGRGIIWDPTHGSMTDETFQHELGHAIDHGVDIYAIFVKNPQNKFTMYLQRKIKEFKVHFHDNPLGQVYKRKSLHYHQKDILNKIFSLPTRTPGVRGDPGWGDIPHCGRGTEIYTSVAMQRQRQGAAYTSEYVEDIYSFWKWNRPEQDSISHDLICAIKKYKKEGLSNEEIANLLNQIAKVEKTKTPTIAE